MPKTISFHNGSNWSRGHNIRDERYTDKQEHIDKALSEQNVTVRDVPVRQAYAEIFGQAVEEYNAKQKRSDRRITDYYDKIKQDKRKHPVYECIVQIGDRSDTGNSAELEKQALIRFAEEWDKRNPNLRLIGAYIHCDEPDGTVHMHIDYIPVAHCDRGMKLQNSLDRALRQQGFVTENIHKTAQIAWQEREREALTSICRELNIDAQHSQGIGQGREYLTPQEYKREKRKQEEQIAEELQPLKDELAEYKELEVSARAFVVDKKKVPFVKRVSVPIEDMERLEEQAKAYRINQSEIETLRTRKQELDERETKLKKNEEVLHQNNQTVKRMYARQRDVNKLLEQAEQQISSLTAENGSLSRAMEQQAKTIHDLQEQLETAQQATRGAYESLANVVKAVGMLKYDQKNGYQVDLSPAQSRLIDAVADYSAEWAKNDGYPDLAESMEKKVGISDGIKDKIHELTPKQTFRHSL